MERFFAGMLPAFCKSDGPGTLPGSKIALPFTDIRDRFDKHDQ